MSASSIGSGAGTKGGLPAPSGSVSASVVVAGASGRDGSGKTGCAGGTWSPKYGSSGWENKQRGERGGRRAHCERRGLKSGVGEGERGWAGGMRGGWAGVCTALAPRVRTGAEGKNRPGSWPSKYRWQSSNKPSVGSRSPLAISSAEHKNRGENPFSTRRALCGCWGCWVGVCTQGDRGEWQKEERGWHGEPRGGSGCGEG
jgi:hypothetical protein